jgi:hypothetical protein
MACPFYHRLTLHSATTVLWDVVKGFQPKDPIQQKMEGKEGAFQLACFQLRTNKLSNALMYVLVRSTLHPSIHKHPLSRHAKALIHELCTVQYIAPPVRGMPRNAENKFPSLYLPSDLVTL